MSIKLEDYAEFLEKVAPEVREVLDSTFQEVHPDNVSCWLEDYMDGGKSLCNLGRGSDLVITYLRKCR